MTLLQFLIIIFGTIFSISAIDAYQRRRLNFFHFFVIGGGAIILIIFSLDINLLNKFGKFFGLTRGADLIVYVSIIVLFWFYFELLNKVVKSDINFTKFVSNEAIENVIEYRKDLGENFFGFVSEKLKFLPKNLKNDFIFLIRAYNEEKTIGKVIDDIFGYGFSKILVINDGSTDNTLKIVKQKQKQYKDKLLIIISHFINRGGGAANKTGIEFLKRVGDMLKINWVVTFDADGQMDISDIDKFLEKLDFNKKIIYLGSRFIKGGAGYNIPFLRKVVLLGSRIITLIFNGVWVSDPHNGYRVLPLHFVRQLEILSDDMTYASELLEQTKRLNYKIEEIPVNIRYTKYSLLKGQKNSNAIKILLELIYQKIFYK